MSTIALKCQDQALTFEHTPLIASGGKEENFVKFNFCQLWDGFAKTAFFWTKDNAVTHATLDADDTCQIPAAITAQDGTIYFGVVGVNTEEEQRCTFAVPYWIGEGVTNPSVEVVDFYTHLLADLAGIASAIPASEKGAAKGVATLDSSGKIPVEQTPIICPQLVITAEKGTEVKVYEGRYQAEGPLVATVFFDEDDTKLVNLPTFGDFTACANYYGETEEQTVTVDAVQQYPLTFELEFMATIVILTTPATVGATVTAVGRETGYTVTGVTGDDGTARLDVHEPDAYDVTATIEGGVFTATQVDITFATEMYDMLYYLDTVLENNSWETIERASRLGMASELWQVGDTKTATCSDGNDRVFVIVGFEHDEQADGYGKAGVTFALKHALDADVMAMQETASNAGGFFATLPCPYLNDTMLNSYFPIGLKNSIKPVKKVTSAGNMSTTLLTEDLPLFLFSEVELYGSASKSVEGEGEQYPYFATDDNRKFYTATNSRKACWLRSPASTDATKYVALNGRGTLTTTDATTDTNYLRFGFCL